LLIYARLHHVTGVIDGRTHVANSEAEHIMSHHVAHLLKTDGNLARYDMHAGHDAVVIAPEHRQYFEEMRDQGDRGPLAFEVYEADAPRPLPPAPMRRHGAITAADLEGVKEQAAAALKQAEERNVTTEAKLARMETMLEALLARQGGALARPAATVTSAPAAGPLVGGVPASFETAKTPEAPAPVETPPAPKQSEKIPAEKPESDAEVMRRTVHATAVRAGFRDKRPPKEP
jgi:hypothetical protein